ncbi:heteroglycan glucosidase 1 [Artemisia annua]|uniref:Heteroglycan glucosidase 1 n=1 Tax=Artemisia annua TaxID=35608 RepID=A0A2U1MQR6_ARTAN|nr:heteroglycan glucosidase 1 [Artemisia annua]
MVQIVNVIFEFGIILHIRIAVDGSDEMTDIGKYISGMGVIVVGLHPNHYQDPNKKATKLSNCESDLQRREKYDVNAETLPYSHYVHFFYMKINSLCTPSWFESAFMPPFLVETLMDRRVWIFLTLNNKSPGEIEGVLFEDNGDGYGYINGDYLLTTYVAELNSSVITFSLKGSEWALNIGLAIESFQWSSFLLAAILPPSHLKLDISSVPEVIPPRKKSATMGVWHSVNLVCQSSNLKGFSKVCLVLEGFLEQHVSEENATRRQVIDKLKTLLQGTSSAGTTQYYVAFIILMLLFKQEYVGIVKAMAAKNGYELDASQEEYVGIVKAMAAKNGYELDASQEVAVYASLKAAIEVELFFLKSVTIALLTGSKNQLF